MARANFPTEKKIILIIYFLFFPSICQPAGFFPLIFCVIIGEQMAFYL